MTPLFFTFALLSLALPAQAQDAGLNKSDEFLEVLLQSKNPKLVDAPITVGRCKVKATVRKTSTDVTGSEQLKYHYDLTIAHADDASKAVTIKVSNTSTIFENEVDEVSSIRLVEYYDIPASRSGTSKTHTDETEIRYSVAEEIDTNGKTLRHITMLKVEQHVGRPRSKKLLDCNKIN